MTRIKVLKALYGDAFIIEIYKGEKSFIMVIDGGPLGALTDLFIEIDKLPKIDMVVLTHFDDDHIGGLLRFIMSASYRDRIAQIKKFWFNLPEFVEMPRSGSTLSYGDSISLFEKMSKLEEELGKTLDWRERVVRKSFYDDPDDLVKITAIAPTEVELTANEAKLRDREKETLTNKGLALLASSDSDLQIDDEERMDSLDSMVANISKRRQIENEASIVMLIEVFDGTKLLFGGDSTASLIVEGLKSLDIPLPISVDLFKVPHHGSRYNISNELLGMVDTSKYLISTNGGRNPLREHHPDRETLAKILLNPHRNKEQKLEVYFSHSIKEIAARRGEFLTDSELASADLNFEVIDNDGSEPMIIIFDKGGDV